MTSIKPLSVITWSIHPRYGYAIFLLQAGRLVETVAETPNEDAIYNWACSRWGKANYFYYQPPCSVESEKEEFHIDFRSGIARLHYLQISPLAFADKAENEWGFFSREALYRRALGPHTNYELLGELSLVDNLPSSSLRVLLQRR